MGIPRLSQDVAPYAESATLGKKSSENTDIQVTNLVIDGPSLVYHVYNALLRYQSNFIAGVGVLPTYARIDACFLHFLQHLTNHGVQVKGIIFDGGLPVSKRPIRQERLEKTRQNLDNYYRLQLQGNNVVVLDSTRSPLKGRESTESNVLDDVLWGTNTATSGPYYHLLPPPPFMVASVFESLLQSDWSNVTHIVPGEADAYCASIAAASGSAILSNDSDFLLYDLGVNGTVILLRTLELDRPINRDLGLLKAQCLRPIVIAKQMNIPNLLTFGFYRSRDSSSGTSVIVNRARGHMVSESIGTWDHFKEEYRIMNTSLNDHLIAKDDLFCALRSLDTRIAELVCSLKNLESIHMYLPTVLEDPTRDSAWSYGLNLRQIAYSILFCCFDHSRQMHDIRHVTEHGRKGPQTAETQIHCVSNASLITKIAAVINKLSQYLNEYNQDDHPGKDTTTKETAPRNASSSANVILSFYLFAADTVIAQRLARSKTYEPSFSRLFRSTPKQFKSGPTWDDIHLHTTTMCTLYSLRMLNQVTNFVLSYRKSYAPNNLKDVLQTLLVSFTTMPTIASLFSDNASLPTPLHTALPSAFLAQRVLRMMSNVDGKTLKRPDDGLENDSGGRNQSGKVTASSHDGRTTKHRWQETTLRSKKRGTTTHTHDLLQRHVAVKSYSSTTVAKQCANAFALLQDGVEDPEG